MKIVLHSLQQKKSLLPMEKRIGGRKTKRNQFSCKLCANPHVTGNYGYCLEHRDRIKKNTKNIKSTSSSSSSSLQTAASSSNSYTVYIPKTKKTQDTSHLSAYELGRLQRIQENEAALAALGLGGSSLGISTKTSKKRRREGACKDCLKPCLKGNYGYCLDHRDPKTAASKYKQAKIRDNLGEREGTRRSARTSRTVIVSYNFDQDYDEGDD